ncbi:PilZ domain-containing protein [Brevibacillus fluminis]|uniref:PilZ domain-containing protein n=1 Tax=Brevibacillus fluminis TaxID=511487 RepID=UPI003F8920EB
MQNKRGFYRLEPKRPFCANMEIIRIRKNVIQTGNAQVCIDDIAAGGLRFVSDLRMIVEEEIVLQFELTMLNQQLKLQGNIVRKVELPDGLFEYGVKFAMDETTIAKLSYQVNQLDLLFRRNPLPAHCYFCSQEEKRGCFKEKSDPNDHRFLGHA